MFLEEIMDKYPMSPCFAAATLPQSSTLSQEETHKIIDPPTMKVSPAEQLKENQSSKKVNDANVELDMCADGSEISIIINGTTLNVTKTSLNATIGNFIISINCCEPCRLMKEDELMLPAPPQPTSLVALGSFIQQNPLHILLGESSQVTAKFSLSKEKLLTKKMHICISKIN